MTGSRPAKPLLCAASALAVLAALLTGCGQGASYCETVKADQARLGAIVGGGGRTALIRALPVFASLQAKAPSDVAADWQLLVTRISALQSALQHAHVDPATYDAQHPPAGLSAEDRTLIVRAATALAQPDTQQALQTVQQEVLDVCHTPLEL